MKKTLQALFFAVLFFPLLAMPPKLAIAVEGYRFETSWPKQPEAWLFYKPSAIAVDRVGNVYVGDTWNNLVKKFSNSGELLLTLGNGDTDEFRFGDYDDVAVDSSGNIYVSDIGQSKIKKFAANGVFLTQWDFQSPSCIEVDSVDNVIVFGYGKGQVFSSSGELLGTYNNIVDDKRIKDIAIGKNDETFVLLDETLRKYKSFDDYSWEWYYLPGECEGASAICVNNDGHLLIDGSTYGDGSKLCKMEIVTNEYGHDVLNIVFSWGTSGVLPGQFGGPQDVAVDHNGRVYVADTYNNRIQVFESNGAFIQEWGRTSDLKGRFTYPKGIAINHQRGEVFVADQANGIQVFSLDGQLKNSWGKFDDSEEGLTAPKDLAIDEERGLVYLVDSFDSPTSDQEEMARVNIYTSSGYYVDTLKLESHTNWHGYYPEFVALDNEGNPFVNIQTIGEVGCCIQKFDQYYGVSEDLGNSDCGDIAFDPDGFSYLLSQTINKNGILSKFDLNNDMVFALEVSGSYDFGEGIKYDEYDVATDKNGNIYVSLIEFLENNYFRCRILKFDSDGNFITYATSPFADPKKPSWPYFDLAMHLAVTESGDTIYATNTYGSRVEVYKLKTVIAAIELLSNHFETSDGSFFSNYGAAKFQIGGDNIVAYRYALGDEPFSKQILVKQPIQLGRLQNGSYRLSVLGRDNEGIWQKEPTVFTWVVDTVAPVVTGLKNDASMRKRKTWTLTAQDDSKILFRYAIDQSPRWENPQGEFAAIDRVTTPPGLDGVWYLHVQAMDAAGNLSEVVTVFAVLDSVVRKDKAVIVAGGGPVDNNIWGGIRFCADFAYRNLVNQGYDQDGIHYLTDAEVADLDGNGFADEKDLAATRSNLADTIQDWAYNSQNLLIYLVGHGGDGTFRIRHDQLVKAWELDRWLDDLQGRIPGEIVLIIDACRSGSFLPRLTAPPGKRRFVVASAKDDQQAIFADRGTLSFSFFMLGRLANGETFAESFQNAKKGIELTTNNFQVSFVDSNGNGVGNEKEDFELAQGVKIGKQLKWADDLPFIREASPPQEIRGTSTARLYAKGVVDANGINSVYAVVVSGKLWEASPDSPVVDLPRIELSKKENGLYEAYYDGFTEPGEYHVTVVAEDTLGNMSMPARTTVTRLGEVSSDLSNLLFFPAVALEGDWETDICIVNGSDEETLVGKLAAYAESGERVLSPVDLCLPPSGRKSIRVSALFENADDIGHLVFQTESLHAAGYARLSKGAIFSETIPAARVSESGEIYVSHIASDTFWTTKFYLVNAAESAKTYDIEFDNGESRTIQLDAKERASFTVEELFDNEKQPELRCATIKNAESLVGIELFYNRSQMAGIVLDGKTAKTIYFPHIASDQAWGTGLVVFNPHGFANHISITPVTAAGSPLASVDFEIASNGRHFGVVKDLNLPSQAAWVRIDSIHPVTGFELFATRNGLQMAGYTGVDISGKEGTLGKIEKKGHTGIAFVNCEDAICTVLMSALDDSGSVVAVEAVLLRPFEKAVGQAKVLFSDDIGSASYIRYSASHRIVAFELNAPYGNNWLDALPAIVSTR